MGQSLCKPHVHNYQLSNDPFQFVQNKDQRQNSINHRQPLRAKNQELQKNLDIFSQFLSQQKSLYKDPLLKSEQITLKSKDKQIRCQYQRPYKFIYEGDKNTPYKVFNRDSTINCNLIKVKDPVMQYFGVFLCFLADHQRLIEKIILTQQNTFGLQVVAVNRRGKEQFILVDDLILCQGNYPRFAQPVYANNNFNKPYLWPCIIQKAWLKLKGSAMRKIMRVSPQQVFESFLQYPLQKIILQGQQQSVIVGKLKRYLYQLEQYNGCILTSKQEPRHKIGLSGKKNFYYILSFNFDGKRLFYIRNPCGSMDFRGSYFDIPQGVKQILYQDYQITQIPQGNFILDQQEMIQQISYATIIHYNEKSIISSEQINFQPNQQFFVSFELRQAAPLCLRLAQYCQNNENHLQNYYPLTYQLINTSQRKIIGGLENQQACFGMKNSYFLPDVLRTVPIGKYILRLKKKITGRPIQSTETVLIANYPSLIRFSYTNQEQISTRYYDILSQICNIQLKQKIVGYSPQKKMVNRQDVDHIVQWFGDIVAVYIKKNSDKKENVNVQVYFPQLVNLKCISHPELKKGQYKSFEISDDLLIVFEKIDLTEETQMHKYLIESY